MMWEWGHMGVGMGGSQAVFWVLLFALIAAGTVVAVLVLSRDGRLRDGGRADERNSPNCSTAEAELEMRYARGEIDADTLARGRAALRQR